MIPDHVKADLLRLEQETEEADYQAFVGRDARIDEEVYRLEKCFSVDDLESAIKNSSAEDWGILWSSLDGGDAHECLAILQDIRDAWIKKTAEEIVDGA